MIIFQTQGTLFRGKNMVVRTLGFPKSLHYAKMRYIYMRNALLYNAYMCNEEGL